MDAVRGKILLKDMIFFYIDNSVIQKSVHLKYLIS